MSPSPSSTNPKTGSDDNSSRLSEAALRKKKNADAQAAFRARRANYIATLEETVTNLEAVVIQLQDSCREVKRENAELRAENQRLKQEGRRSERLLKRCLPGKIPDMGSDHEEFMPAPPYSVHPPSATMPSTPMSSAHMTPYSDDTVNYGSDYQASMASTSYNGQEYPQRSPALGFARSIDGDASVDNHAQHMDAHRMSRFDQYGYAIDPNNCEGTWPQEVLDSGSSSHSPTYVESPILTSPELAYPSRFSVVEDQKVPLSALNTSYNMFPASRSISPASTPTSTSSVSLSSAPFQFTFPEGNVVQERPEFGYRRHTGPELTLHGGTANIPIAATGGDALRYRLAARSNTAPERPMATAISQYSRADNGSGGRESDSESAYTYATRSRPRSAASSTRVSRSPSPPPICGTLAVIKAQAFGALRRTRTRSKKSSEGAAKAAVEALEARGINMGIAVGSATKRPRLRMDDDNDMQT